MRIPGQRLFADLTEQAETPIVASRRLGHSDGAASAPPPTRSSKMRMGTVPPLTGGKLNPR